jgi:hypothetical protein
MDKTRHLCAAGHPLNINANRLISTLLLFRVLLEAPNLALQRSGTYKVLGRGRPSPAHGLVPRARVLIRWRAAAELGS